MIRLMFVLLLAGSLLAGSVHAAPAESFLKEGAPKAGSLPAQRQLPDFTQLVKEVARTVVNISGEAAISDTTAEPPADGLPFHRRGESGRPARSLGSGFIVNEQGFIVTNFHVIDGADRIVVRLLEDESEYIASVIGKDQKSDIALLKIEPKGKLPVALLGDSDKVEEGEWVVAIGNQFQLGQTVTAGIVSARARRVPALINGPYDNFIQTDASINPGSSGGPLINTHGQVIGVNTAIFSPGRTTLGGTGFNIGIGFATPITPIKSVIMQLKEQGHVTRGLLGVVIQRVDVDMAAALGLEGPGGALVADVMPDTPADRAKFQRRDVIVTYMGHGIKEHDDLPLLVANTPVGTTVDVEVIRDGKRMTLQPKIEELKELALPEQKEEEKPNEIGVVAQNLTESTARAINETETKGVVIAMVQPGSLAERAGIARADVIREIDGKAIENKEGFEAAIKTLEKGKPVLVLIRRREGTRFLTLKKE